MSIDFDGVNEARRYLETGGLGEVLGLASAALEVGHPKVQMDSDMAIALCMMADDALKASRAASESAAGG